MLRVSHATNAAAGSVCICVDPISPSCYMRRGYKRRAGFRPVRLIRPSADISHFDKESPQEAACLPKGAAKMELKKMFKPSIEKCNLIKNPIKNLCVILLLEYYNC